MIIFTQYTVLIESIFDYLCTNCKQNFE